MSVVIDFYKEGYYDPPSEPKTRPFYTYNQNGKTEFLGVLTYQNSEDEDDEDYKEPEDYERTILYKKPLGWILTDFISADINELNKLVSEETTGLELLSALEHAKKSYIFSETDDMTNMPFVRDRVKNCIKVISFIRRYIDVCNKNAAFFTRKWFNAFMSADYNRPFSQINAHFLVNENEFLKFSEFFIKEKSTVFDIYVLSPYQSKPVQEYISDKDLVIQMYENPVAYLYWSLGNLVDNKLMPKHCPNCGKYFIPENRSDTVYCSRHSPQDHAKNCKQYSYELVRQKRLESSEALNLYRKLYQRKQMKYTRNKDETSRLDFEDFKRISKKWRVDVKAGIRKESEFLAWLKTFL